MEKRPEMKESVGAIYYAFNNGAGTDFDLTKYDEIIETQTVKKVGITENTEDTKVYASGKTYKQVSMKSDEDISIETIAFDYEDLVKMRGDTITKNGLIVNGSNPIKPYFAFGKVVLLTGGKYRLDWYPKCQLKSNTDDTSTREEKFSEQTDTIVINAMPFDSANNIKMSISNELKSFPVDMTIDKFFSQVITSDDDLAKIITKAA